MGCGRSGTWLLTAAFSTFGDLDVMGAESPAEAFGMFATDKPALLVKRDHVAYQRIEELPDSIEIAIIVRHPFAVLTSHNPVSRRAYHIAPHRWLGEMLALQYLLDTRRPATVIVRYEDLVTDPDRVQTRLSEAFRLPIAHPMSAIAEVFRPPASALSAMHGLRPVDRDSVEKYKHDPEKIAYLRSIRPRLGRLLTWVAEEYGYDIEI
ncbi:MAG: hypothetical protein WDM94_02385 [Bauldia sp.]